MAALVGSELTEGKLTISCGRNGSKDIVICELSDNATVFHLKKEILVQYQSNFTKAFEVTIWKVSIPADSSDEDFSIDTYPEKEKELNSTRVLKNVFKDLPPETIHVIFEIPSPGKIQDSILSIIRLIPVG